MSVKYITLENLGLFKTNVDTVINNAVSSLDGNLATVAKSGSYADLSNKPLYAASAVLSINDSTYVVSLQLKDQNGDNLGQAQTIDLPLESVVVSGSYDDNTKKIILTLQGGSTVEFSVADLVSGLQSEITTTNKLDADLVDDTDASHKFVTATEKGNIHTHSNKALLDTYTQTEANLADAVSKKHSHSNKSILDNITAAYTEAEATKLAGIDAGADVNVIEGVQVNGTDLTPDANKKVNVVVPTAVSDLTNDADYQSGTEVESAITTAIASKQDVIDSSHKLDADLVDDTNATNKFVAAADITKLAGIEAGAEVNIIEGVQVNGTDLTPDANRKVNVVVPAIPTDVSAFNNDAGYLTQHQDISNKTDRSVEGTNGTALIFNESEGGGAKFEHKDGTYSFVGVNDGGKDGIAGQIYVVNKNDPTEGVKINLEKGRITYIKNKATSARTADDEIATVGQVNAKQEALTAGSNIQINNGTISATDTTYGTATSLVAGLVKSSTTGSMADRDYNVQVNNDGTMKVNVPWTDTYPEYASDEDINALFATISELIAFVEGDTLGNNFIIDRSAKTTTEIDNWLANLTYDKMNGVICYLIDIGSTDAAPLMAADYSQYAGEPLYILTTGQTVIYSSAYVPEGAMGTGSPALSHGWNVEGDVIPFEVGGSSSIITSINDSTPSFWNGVFIGAETEAAV